jgi:hypothetical protein
MSNDRTLSGADEFLPILFYITIKASSSRQLYLFIYFNFFLLVDYKLRIFLTIRCRPILLSCTPI